MHEIKTPLMGVKGLASTLSRLYDSMTEQERREFVVLLDQESERLTRVIEQASAVLRIEADEATYDVFDQRIAQVLRDAATQTTRRSGRKVSVEVDDDLHAACDITSLRWILDEALRNADEFSPPNSPVIIAGEVSDVVRIEVADEGPGLPPGTEEAAFERCARVRPPGYEEAGGAGLSLYLSRLQARAQGGDVTLARDGGRTVFTLTLDRAHNG